MQELANKVLETNGVPKAVLLKAVIDSPEVIQKMRNYVTLFGVVPSDNNQLLPLQVSNIKNQIRQIYLKKTRKDFLNKDDFDRHIQTDSFEGDYDNFEEQYEAQQGFDGFDSDYDNFFDTALRVGGKLLGKGIKAVGGAIKKKQEKKANARAQTAQADSVIAQQSAKKELISNGASAQDIDKGILQATKKIVGEDRQGTTKVLDFLNKTVADYKKNEEMKAIKSSMPMIIGIVLVVAFIGYMLGKK